MMPICAAILVAVIRFVGKPVDDPEARRESPEAVAAQA
jgi:hypothetical protein